MISTNPELPLAETESGIRNLNARQGGGALAAVSLLSVAFATGMVLGALIVAGLFILIAP